MRDARHHDAVDVGGNVGERLALLRRRRRQHRLDGAGR